MRSVRETKGLERIESNWRRVAFWGLAVALCLGFAQGAYGDEGDISTVAGSGGEALEATVARPRALC